MMVVTERQFNAIDLLIGEEKTCDLPQNSKQLMELKKTVQTSHAKSVPFLPVFRAYLLDFQQIGTRNKRPDIIYYTTTRKYRELL